MTNTWCTSDKYIWQRYLNKEMVVMWLELDANIWPAARDAEEIFWQIIIFQTFPVQGIEACDRAVTRLFPTKPPKPLHIFSKKQHFCRVTSHIWVCAGLRFVCCRDLDLFGMAQTVFLWYCGLYLCALQSSVIYCPSFLSAAPAAVKCRALWKPLICCRVAH